MVVDLPFGRRHGSHRQNQSLYPRALRECARVVRVGGKAIMLTMDKAVMKHAWSNNKQERLPVIQGRQNHCRGF
eukprot:1382_2